MPGSAARMVLATPKHVCLEQLPILSSSPSSIAPDSRLRIVHKYVDAAMPFFCGPMAAGSRKARQIHRQREYGIGYASTSFSRRALSRAVTATRWPARNAAFATDRQGHSTRPQ